MRPVLFVREQAYLASVNAVRESRDCLTHIADLHHPEHGPGRYYVKRYLEGRPAPSKGLVNEVCGYMLAGAAGLPVPEQALILELPADRIAEMHPAHASQAGGGKVLVWATRDAGEALPRDQELAGASLRRWKGLPDVIAFDSWVVIPDRSSSNIARRRNGQLVLIDHGHVGGSVCWQADMLPTEDERPHAFMALWRPGQVPEQVNQGIIVAAEGHEDCLTRARPELNRFAEVLLQDPEATIALLRFLEERARSSPARMKRVLQMLA